MTSRKRNIVSPELFGEQGTYIAPKQTKSFPFHLFNIIRSNDVST